MGFEFLKNVFFYGLGALLIVFFVTAALVCVAGVAEMFFRKLIK